MFRTHDHWGSNKRGMDIIRHTNIVTCYEIGSEKGTYPMRKKSKERRYERKWWRKLWWMKNFGLELKLVDILTQLVDCYKVDVGLWIHKSGSIGNQIVLYIDPELMPKDMMSRLMLFGFVFSHHVYAFSRAKKILTHIQFDVYELHYG